MAAADEIKRIMPSDFDDYQHYNIDEVAKIINFHKSNTSHFLALNAVPCVCYARKRQYLWKDIKSFIDGNREVTA